MAGRKSPDLEPNFKPIRRLGSICKPKYPIYCAFSSGNTARTDNRPRHSKRMRTTPTPISKDPTTDQTGRLNPIGMPKIAEFRKIAAKRAAQTSCLSIFAIIKKDRGFGNGNITLMCISVTSRSSSTNRWIFWRLEFIAGEVCTCGSRILGLAAA